LPSGRTHDRVTLWSLPAIASLTFLQTRNSHYTLLVAGGFLFSGLMFGPDLDIYSRQYIRWGWLRWLWRPYQKVLRHRSVLSHGPILGTTLRIAYLGSWIVLLGTLAITAWATWQQLRGVTGDWQALAAQTLTQAGGWIGRSLQAHVAECAVLWVGLELGAMSHALCDWGGSAYKRFGKQGWSGVFSDGKRKRKKNRRR
jgi:uncharacterized metal-binding protein